MACQSLTLGIAKDCKSSMGGIKAIWLSDNGHLQFSGSGGDIAVVPATSGWYKFNTRKNVSSMTSTLNIDESNGTNYVTTELNIVFARMSADKRQAINVLKECELNAVVEDNNGNAWALGRDNPVTVTAGTVQTGTAAGDGNNYSITLTDISNDLPYPVEEESMERLHDVD